MNTSNQTTITKEGLQKSFAILREQHNFLEKAHKDEDEMDKSKETEEEKLKNAKEEEEERLKKAKEKEMEKGKEHGGFKADKTVEELEKEVERKKELKKSAEDCYGKMKEKGHDAHCEDMIRKGFSLSECQGSWEAAVSAAKAAPNGGEITGAELRDVNTSLSEHDGEKITKSVEAVILKGNKDQEALLKGMVDFFGAKFNAIADITEGHQQNIERLEKSLESTLAANNSLVEKLNALPVTRRSITTQRQIERFEKSKDGDKSKEADNKTVFDVRTTKGRRGLMSAIEEHAEYRGDRELQNAVSQLEITKSLDPIALKHVRGIGLDVVIPARSNDEDE